MFDKFKRLTSSEKGMIVLIVILFLGILVRWGYVRQNAQKGFDKYLNSDTTKNR